MQPHTLSLAVIDAINSERDYQKRMWPSTAGAGSEENFHTVGESLLLLEEYVAKARAQWTTEGKPELATMHIVRKIAGIAVRCMEQHGAFPRE